MVRLTSPFPCLRQYHPSSLSTSSILQKTNSFIPSSIYCHPTYARHMRGYGVDPNAPRFPLVIPTLLFRPFQHLWRPIFASLAWCLGTLCSSLLPSFFTTEAAASPYTGWTTTSNRAFDRAAAAGSRIVEESASKLSWFRRSREGTIGRAWGDDEGSVRRMNVWDQGMKGWEVGDGEGGSSGWEHAESMLDDDYV